MKLNNKGFAISTVMYIILIMALVLIVSILGMLSSRKMTLDKVKDATLTEVKSRVFAKIYNVGDKIKVAGEYYYVISRSSRRQDYVTALKEHPLTVDEVNNNKIGSDGENHVNRYGSTASGEASNENGYGGLTYYSSENCNQKGSGEIYTDCKKDYNESDIKYVVDAWASSTFNSGELIEIDGNKARLISQPELVNDLGCTSNYCSNSQYNWLYNSNYWYWTMTPEPNYHHHMYTVDSSGNVRYCNMTTDELIRPVINVYKSAIEEE